MSFTLIGSPPAKNAAPTPDNVAALEAWLGSIIAFRAQTSEQPWTFYEQMEVYLGPWGEQSYPIGYGIKYCKIFFFDEGLRASSAGQAWVRRTLILLQLALKAMVMRRFKARTLGAITADEFKQAAFDSHPVAYTEGGLAMLMMLNPLLTPQILALAGSEFLPTRPNFIPTVKQLVVTSAIAVPQCMIVFALSTGPFAHAGAIRRAYQMDRARLDDTMYLGKQLVEAREAVRSGAADNIAFLDSVRRSVSQAPLPDASLASLARDLISSIEARRAYILARYRREMKLDPNLAEVFQQFDRLAAP